MARKNEKNKKSDLFLIFCGVSGIVWRIQSRKFLFLLCYRYRFGCVSLKRGDKIDPKTKQWYVYGTNPLDKGKIQRGQYPERQEKML